MGARTLVIASVSMCLVPGTEYAYAQSAPGEIHTLPPVEVSAPPASSTKRGRTVQQRAAQQTARAARQPRVVYVYPTTPSSGAGFGSSIDVDKVPASINFVDAAQIARTDSLNITDALLQQVPGISINEVTGNPFQPDVQFRGFVASPVAGTPQGLAVYQNGVRINEAFGDTVNWDLIPTAAIKSISRGDQQSRFRPQCAGRRRQRADEGWLQLSRRRDRHDGRLVRPHPEFGAMGQAGRQQLRRLWRA